MINDNTIISSFNDRPTLLEWLKKVEEALKSDTATGVSVENPSVNAYVFKITFADGKTIASDTIRFPDSVKGVSILNNHLVITMQSGLTDDLGVINPYAETIVSNSETNTTEIRNNEVVDGNLQVNGNVLFGSSIISIQGATKQNGILGTNADGQIAFKEIRGGIRNLQVSPTFVSVNGNHIKNSFTITGEEKAKIINGEIDMISGRARRQNDDAIPFCVTRYYMSKFGPSSAPIVAVNFYGINYDNFQQSNRTLKAFALTISNDTSDLTFSLDIDEFNPLMG